MSLGRLDLVTVSSGGQSLEPPYVGEKQNKKWKHGVENGKE